MSSEAYVCSFRGRRDYYQLPLALSEAGALDEFITDAYFRPELRSAAWMLPTGFRDKLSFRYEPALPDDRIVCLWHTHALEVIRQRAGFPQWTTFAMLDRIFSVAAAARARRTRSHLLLYNPYAWEAFTARYAHAPRKILFQYHPHPDLERRVLLADSAKHKFFHHSYEDEVGDHVSDEIKRRNRDCWRYADLVLCASSFTKRSLVEAGADPNLCKIVPYGMDVPRRPVQMVAPDTFQALFVGTGTQRKGLHHLLLAWQRAVLPRDSMLTVVCRAIDPGLETLIQQTPNTRLLRGVSANGLTELFGTSSLFVMPSLVEGFGQVFLEALAQGCPVLGTVATCLPDLGPAPGAIFEVGCGNIDQLVYELERLSKLLPGSTDCRREAMSIADRWPWIRFRQGVRLAIGAN